MTTMTRMTETQSRGESPGRASKHQNDGCLPGSTVERVVSRVSSSPHFEDLKRRLSCRRRASRPAWLLFSPNYHFDTSASYANSLHRRRALWPDCRLFSRDHFEHLNHRFCGRRHGPSSGERRCPTVYHFDLRLLWACWPRRGGASRWPTGYAGTAWRQGRQEGRTLAAGANVGRQGASGGEANRYLEKERIGVGHANGSATRF
jgi:hypothetical protein